MKATILLADHADVANGKLYINGGGWTITGPQPIPSAIALLVHVPWDQTNTKHKLVLELLDSDGSPVMPDGENPVKVGSEIEVGRPVGVKPGTPLAVPFAMNFGPIPLAAGSQYVWILSIDGHSDEDWRLTFTTRPGAPEALAA
jgi:hypothetical protein